MLASGMTEAMFFPLVTGRFGGMDGVKRAIMQGFVFAHWSGGHKPGALRCGCSRLPLPEGVFG